jgi:hypothetical protein
MIFMTTLDGLGLSVVGDGARVSEKTAFRRLRERLKELFKVIGEKPVVIVKHSEVVTSDSGQSSP